MAVGVTAAAQEGEGGVDFAGHQQEDEDGAEAAAADCPLLQVHVAPVAGPQTEHQCSKRGKGNDGEGGAHWRRFTGSVR